MNWGESSALLRQPWNCYKNVWLSSSSSSWSSSQTDRCDRGDRGSRDCYSPPRHRLLRLLPLVGHHQQLLLLYCFKLSILKLWFDDGGGLRVTINQLERRCPLNRRKQEVGKVVGGQLGPVYRLDKDLKIDFFKIRSLVLRVSLNHMVFRLQGQPIHSGGTHTCR